MKKIKILQFPIGDTKGGITQYALMNWRYIDKKRYQFDFATMSPTLSFEKDLLDSGAGVYHIESYAEDDIRGFEEKFREILIRGRYDIVHLHTSYWKSLAAEQLAKEEKVKGVIIHAHASAIAGAKRSTEKEREKLLVHHNEILNQLNQYVATDYWACSNEAGKFLFGNRIPISKVKILNNAVDVKRFCYNHKKRKCIRNALQLENHLVLGYVARFEYPKNQIFLLRIMNILKKEGLPIKLVLVGQGSELPKCQEFVEANGLSDSVIFTGFRSDVDDLLQGFDLLVFPSENEGFPIALVEAQSAGLFCIVSDCIKSDINITGRVKSLPLKENVWRDEILKFKSKDMTLDRENININGSNFDIYKQIKIVERMYDDIAKRKL